MLNLEHVSKTSRHFNEKASLSHCARGLHIAGPLERLSIRNWSVAASVTTPVHPPSASISRTICPLAIPPTAGLHDIFAKPFRSGETSRTDEPSEAAAIAASQPACPPPTTMMSKREVIRVPGGKDSSSPWPASQQCLPWYDHHNRSGAGDHGQSPGSIHFRTRFHKTARSP